MTFYRPLIVPYPSAWYERTTSITRTKNAREREINERDGTEFDFLRFCAIAGKYACNNEMHNEGERKGGMYGRYLFHHYGDWMGAPIKSCLGTRLALIKVTAWGKICASAKTSTPIENIFTYKCINIVDRESEKDPWTRWSFRRGESIDYSVQFYERMRHVDKLIDVTSRVTNPWLCYPCRYDCSIALSDDICERRPMNLGQFANCLGRLRLLQPGIEIANYNCDEFKFWDTQYKHEIEHEKYPTIII